MKTSVMSKTNRLWRAACVVAALCLGWLPASPAHAGLTLYFELDHSGGDSPYYLCFVTLNTNSDSANPPNTGYFAWSHSSSINSGINAQVNPDGTASYNGGYFSDYDSLIAEFTNTWMLEVTNATSTNSYTFHGSYFSSNALPWVAMTFPTNGSTNITNQPTFTWEGTTNIDNLYVQLTDTNSFVQEAHLPITQTNWPCPVALSGGDTYDFYLDYNTNVNATIVASTPLNNLSQPFPGWVSTCTMFSYDNSTFTVNAALLVPPLLEYPMNERNWTGTAPQVVDSTGNGYNGTAVGGANTVSDPSFGQVGSFDGSGQYVTVAGASYSMSGARTIVAWVDPVANDSSLGQPIVVGGSTGAADLFGISGTGGENNGLPQYELFVDDWNTPTYHSTATITPGEWNFVAMTYDGTGTVHFYINGVDAGFGSDGSSPFALYTYDVNTYVVGGTTANTDGQTTMNDSFNGLMADVGIYASQLTPDQIATLYTATYPLAATPAGLTLHFEIDHNGPSQNSAAYYLLFPELSANSSFTGPPGATYFVSSYTSACTAQINPDGTTAYNGGYFPDYNSLITEFTNTWTLEVSNSVITNLYTFKGTYFSSNTMPVIEITFPADGSTNITNQPTFAWQGTTNINSLAVQVTGPSNFVSSANLPITQTTWPCPVALSSGNTYSFIVNYATNEDATILATTPLDNMSQPISDWVSTCTLFDDDGSSFSVNSGPPPVLPQPGNWIITGGMTTVRALHTLTLLSNGLVLASAGEGAGFLSVSTAELYNPAFGTWQSTGSLKTDRYGHAANLLGNGKVLVTGGIQSSTGTIASSELYNPATAKWETNASMTSPRYAHTATLLGNGKVLATGGQGAGNNNLASAELYDPNLGTWTATGTMTNGRAFHTATLLTNGWVLVAGGEDTNQAPLATAMLYNPDAALWTATGLMTTARTGHTATLLPNGKVLVAGGNDTQFNPQASAELYDPVAGTWAATGTMSTRRVEAQATLLTSGLVLIAGPDNSAELYNPATEMWTTAASMHNQREDFPEVLLPSGEVLVAGGFFGGSLTNAELYSSISGLPIILSNPTKLSNGAFQFTFTNIPGGTFTALATTNLSSPLSNWTVLGTVPAISSGLFQFTDPATTNTPRRFYGVRSP
jgi:hypothetical protein